MKLLWEVSILFCFILSGCTGLSGDSQAELNSNSVASNFVSEEEESSYELALVEEQTEEGEITDSVAEALEEAAEAGKVYVPEEITEQDGELYIGGVAADESVTSIDLSAAQIADYSILSNYPWLTSLTVSDPDLEDLSFLSTLPNLQILTLSCGADDFTPLSNLHQLKMLFMNGNDNLTDLSFLKGASSIEALIASYNYNLRDISALSACSQMTMLSLGEDGEIEDFSSLANMTSLTQVYLQGTQFSDLHLLDGLSSLNSLGLPVTVTDYTAFANADYMLDSLQLSNYDEMDEETLAWIMECFPQCSIS